MTMANMFLCSLKHVPAKKDSIVTEAASFITICSDTEYIVSRRMRKRSELVIKQAAAFQRVVVRGRMAHPKGQLIKITETVAF